MAISHQEIESAFADDERQIAMRRIRIGCWLIMTLLPAGAMVDYFVYRSHLREFLAIRLVGSVLVAPLLALVNTQWGSQRHRVLAVVIAMIPAACMAWIIHRTQQGSSPYYAGLNLILLAIGLVLQWTLVQSVVAVLLVLCMYFAACFAAGGYSDFGTFFNNVWFLLLTGIIVVIGNTFQSRLRFREFALRYELNQREKELERSNRRLMELDELKGRFFANISHELRTPLTLLLAPLQTIRQQFNALPDPRFQEWLDTMHANGMRLLKLINDLLELVRLDSGKLRLRPVRIELDEFLRGIINSIRRLAEEKGLRVTSNLDESLSVICADADKLEKICLNLFFNAVKFTPAGGTVSVHATREGDFAVIEVTDTGVGIAEEDLPFIFERFWQADSAANRKFQGTGIGLALVKELVEAHRGTVEARSRSGSGTTMVVRLPIGADPQLTPSESPEPVVTTPESASSAHGPNGDVTQGWLAELYRRAEMFHGIAPLREAVRPWTPVGSTRRPRMLVAEDEPDMLRFLRSQLSDDYEVLEAVDGEQATSMAAQYLPEVVLCDMMLPEKDGLQVCQELRARAVTRAIPFLMLTARADDETKLQALAAGANDFVAKPFSTAELRVRLKNLVDAHQLQKALAWQNQKLEATLEQLKETELQLVQSEKMASLGRMSAGIIHEINNPLNFAKTGLFTLARKSGAIPEPERAEYEETVRDIEEGLMRVAGIVSDLRAFTHPQGGSVENVDVGGCVGAALRFLAAEWKDKVEVRNEIPADFKVRANRNKVMQVFVNLLQNSLDALRQKSFAEGEQPAIRIRTEEKPGARFVFIWDNGAGISAENLGKIFDPFFTTKDVGQGTGLGLSICYRILNEAGGHISVQSEAGQFCEFTLEFAVNT